MGLKLITPPASEPILLSELKSQSKIDTTDDDTLLALIIAAARAKAENYTGTALISQTWDQTLDAFPCAEIELLKPPVTSIASLTYVDVNGATQTLDPSLYTLDSATFPGWVLPKFNTSWPATQAQANAVTIRLVTGYANAGAIPPDMRAWLLMTAAFLNTNRDAFVIDGKVTEIPSRFLDSLLDPYRVFKA